MEATQRETKPPTTAGEPSRSGRKMTSGWFYSKSGNHTEGLTAMCTGVIMSRSARVALSLSPGRSGKVPVLLLRLAQSCPASPVHCGLAPLYAVTNPFCPRCDPSLLLHCYLGIRLCLSFWCLWKPWSLCLSLGLRLTSWHRAGMRCICAHR